MKSKDRLDLAFYVILLIGTIATWFLVRSFYIKPEAANLIKEFQTQVIIYEKEDAPKEKPKDKKPAKVKEPTQKPQVSKQTKANTRKANALAQCSNVTVGCMAELERIARDSAARQSIRGSK